MPPKFFVLIALAVSLVANGLLAWRVFFSATTVTQPTSSIREVTVLSGHDALKLTKSGVDMLIYPQPPGFEQAAVVYQQTKVGHFEEFYNTRSHHIYYVLEGQGTWHVEGHSYPVQQGDVVIVPPNKRFYYDGSLRQLCITTPAWRKEDEHHVRNIER